MNEIIGLSATVFIIAGFLLNGEARIRALNIVGAALYVAYGILIESPSNVVLNGVLIIIHAIKIYKMKQSS